VSILRAAGRRRGKNGDAVAVREGLLALLAEAPAHGYQLKTEFEQRTGGSWQLNIGQVYTTLQRLERDGLVTAVDEDAGDERRTVAITDAGRAELDRWYAQPILPVPPPRDELAIKVLLALDSPDVDVTALLQHQRVAVVGHLQDLTRQKRATDPTSELARLLHLDALILAAEAEARWLDHCEARLRGRVAVPADDPTRPADGPPTRDPHDDPHDPHHPQGRPTARAEGGHR
jgi:DNA-binding PadR family transcriptional regulator